MIVVSHTQDAGPWLAWRDTMTHEPCEKPDPFLAACAWHAESRSSTAVGMRGASVHLKVVVIPRTWNFYR